MSRTQRQFTLSSVDLLCQRVILFLFSMLVFTVPLFFTWVNEELFEFNKMILTYAFTGMIVGVWAVRQITQGKLNWRRTPFDIPIALFLISQLISTVLSLHPRTSFFGYYTRFHGGLLSTFCYIALFYAAVHNLERRHLRPLLLSIFSSAFIVSLMAIPEHFGHSFSCLLINTSQQTTKSGAILDASNLWANYNVTCWIQDVQNRVFASFGQPNWLAAYAVTLIPLGIILTLTRKKVEQFFYGSTTVLLFLTLLFTKSRSGFLGLVVGGGLFFVLAAIAWFGKKEKEKQSFSRSNIIATAVVGALILASAVWFGTPYTKALSSIGTSQPEPAVEATQTVNRLDVGGTNSGEIRRIVWIGALGVWRRYPLFGSGVETFAYSYYKDRPMAHNNVSEWDFLYNKAHNEFLNFLATTGIVGLVAYVVLLAAFIGLPILKIGHTKSDVEQKLFYAAVSGGLLALTVSNFFGFSTVMVTILLFLYPAFFIILSMPGRDLPKLSESYSSTQLAGVGVVGLSTLIWVFWIWTMWAADHTFTLGKAYNQLGHVSEAVQTLEKAVQMSPNEGVFTEELSLAYARLGVAVAEQTQDATLAAQVGQRAATLADSLVKNNPVNLNFYKTKTRVDLTLAQIQPMYLLQARDTLLKARELAPTDPKIVFNLAVVELSLKMTGDAILHLELAIIMKPDYEAARMMLAEEYQRQNRLEDAKLQLEHILQYIQPNNEEAKQMLEVITSSISAQKKPTAAPAKK